MRCRNIILFFVLLLSVAGKTQDSVNLEDMFVQKDFLILLSTKNYKAALATAKKVSSSMNMKLDLRGLTENTESGLTFSKEDCEKEEIDYPAYLARGRDDGIYVSVEYSDAYKEFAKGYYIVIAASGERNDPDIQKAYKKIKTSYKDAYFKSSKVYMGCMH